MIPRADILEWRARHPWSSDDQVEQDLVISRAIVEIFRDSFLCEHLAFRGGTAMHKLFISEPLRYSEDIDLVQVSTGQIGPIFDAVRMRLDPLLGEPKRELGKGIVNLIYRFSAEGPAHVPLRLKIEINSREHFTVLGHEDRRFDVDSRWFRGGCEVRTYRLEELLGTKLRALHQRKKGRDLFDLWLYLTTTTVDESDIVRCFQEYLSRQQLRVSAKAFRESMAVKLSRPDFRNDTRDLLRTGVSYDLDEAWRLVDERLVAHID